MNEIWMLCEGLEYHWLVFSSFNRFFTAFDTLQLVTHAVHVPFRGFSWVYGTWFPSRRRKIPILPAENMCLLVDFLGSMAPWFSFRRRKIPMRLAVYLGLLADLLGPMAPWFSSRRRKIPMRLAVYLGLLADLLGSMDHGFRLEDARRKNVDLRARHAKWMDMFKAQKKTLRREFCAFLFWAGFGNGCYINMTGR